MRYGETTGIKGINEEIEITTTQNESPPAPPTVLEFLSIDEIKDFVIASWDTKENFYEYVAAQDKYALTALPYETRLEMSANIQSCDMPIIKENVILNDFGASYTEERDELDIRYIMDGIRYRFTYRFNYNKIHTNDSFPVAEGVKIGDREVDIYQNDYSFYATYSYGTTTVFVNIFAENVSDVSFDCFKVESLVTQ